jgi:cytochrome P450
MPGGQMRPFRRDPLNFLSALVREYGDVAQFRIGPQKVFVLSNPEHIRDVLVTHHDRFHKGRALKRSKRVLGEGLLTSEGAHHRRQRRLAQPAFHRHRIASYGAVMAEAASRASARWHDGETLDMAAEMMRLTLAIVGKTLFDADVEDDADEIGSALNDVIDLFGFLLLPYSELLEKLPLPLPPLLRLQRARERLDAIIYRIIDERRASGEDHGDLLSMLLLAEDEEEKGARMSNEQVRDEVMTLFLAGHETTANLMTWTWYLLWLNPHVESELHAELDSVLEDGRPATVDDLPKLRFTEMVLAETMRLYPPAWAVGRTAVEDHEVAGYVIPSGSLVLLSQYIVHRDARFFPEPERFDPHRWTTEAKESRPQFSYFPFGGGVRRCIGEGFAWMEGSLLLATLARRWKTTLASRYPVERSARLTLRPKKGMLMHLERRGA